MLSRFLNFIEEEGLFKKENSILLAISGGKDSVVLLDLLLKSGFKPALAHCNFKLRGIDSDDDEQFVKELALNNDLIFYSKSFDTKKYASEKGVSTQMAARDLRYNWFKELVKEKQLDYILTAHHLNDSFETTIYNLAKGTGVSGLRGISIKNDSVIRPLLFFSREDINRYASENNIDWREDASNASTDYSRNFIRHEIIPKLLETNPGLIETYINTSKRLRSTEKLIDKALKDFEMNLTKSDVIEIPFELINNTELVVLEAYLKKFEFNFNQTELLKALVRNGMSGKRLDSNQFELLIDRKRVLLYKKSHVVEVDIYLNETDKQIVIGGKKISFDITDDVSILTGQYIERLDFRKLIFPLRIRNWKEGDEFHPLGMKGKKKLSDFMIDEKIPLNLKSSVLVLISENEIASVLGYRIDDRFKLTPDSKQAFQITIEND